MELKKKDSELKKNQWVYEDSFRDLQAKETRIDPSRKAINLFFCE